MTTMAERKGARYHGLPVSREEYLDLRDDGFQYDMVEGVLFVSPSAEPLHGIVGLKFGHVLSKYLEKNPIGLAMIEIDIMLPDGGDVLRPDISFVLHENTRILLKHIHGVPDLVCEVLSDSTARRDLNDKADRFLKNGVREYWIVDPRDRTAQVWINRKLEWEKRTAGILRSELLSGFEIDPDQFFAGIKLPQ